MGLTMAEKVFSRCLGSDVKAGNYVVVPVDKAMCHEGFLLSSIKLMTAGIEKIWIETRGRHHRSLCSFPKRGYGGGHVNQKDGGEIRGFQFLRGTGRDLPPGDG